MATIIRKIFHRKRKPPLACSEIPLEELDSHVHTDACFLPVEPLTVAEIFQSQGCKACIKNVPRIHEAGVNPNIALLTFNVTYFDKAEWSDTFAAKSWDARQRGYVVRWGRKSVFTPEVVVDGVVDGTGTNEGETTGLIEQARTIRRERGWNILLDANDTELRIDSDRAESPVHEILVIFYDPAVQNVKIGKGVTKGKKLAHRNVVKRIVKAGVWEGGNLTLPLPDVPEARGQGWAALLIVQEPQGGPIVAAHTL
ncbi:thioredoxin-like protein [Aspergillus stella-maris]|uniref:thioredoxin-like protein n=1 Tax=Aspergillus stella-maris TaxID=1810926 RepID=UPI003CCD64BE